MRKPLTHILLIASLGLIVYCNTFNVPFQWDEGMTIIDNPIVKDLRYFLHPSDAKGFGKLYYSFRDRYMGYLTFALNYRLHGLDVKGYHVVNIALHILNSLLVYALVRLTFRTPWMSFRLVRNHAEDGLPTSGNDKKGTVIAKSSEFNYIPLFVSLIFVSHPIQTEAVNYVMGRLPLLMWFFYLSSMVLYAKWRLTSLTLNPSPSGRGQGVRVILYSLSLLSAVLAMKTKENAFSLPLSIALYEFLFFRSPDPLPHPQPLSLWERVAGGRVRGHRLLSLAPFMLTLLIIPLSLMSFDKPIGEVIGGIESASRHYTEIPRMNYFFTQFSVLVTYLRLLFLPINQNFDYDYPVYNSFFVPHVFLSFLFLFSIFCLGAYLFYRSRKGNPALRLLAWGVFWFFLTLSVESSIFPIPVIISEYRLYAPSMGIFLTVIAALIAIAPKRVILSALTVIIIVLSGAAYARNGIWRNRISLWEDVVNKSPQNPRGHVNLGKACLDVGLTDKAINYLRHALLLDPAPDVYFNLGVAYHKKEMFDAAISHYKEALRIKPDYLKARYNLANAYYNRGQTENARKELIIILEINPEFPLATQLLNDIVSMETPVSR